MIRFLKVPKSKTWTVFSGLNPKPQPYSFVAQVEILLNYPLTQVMQMHKLESYPSLYEGNTSPLPTLRSV